MPHGGPLERTAAAMRTALVGRAVRQFDGPAVEGPHPTPGRVIERVECRGRALEVMWDDGLILHTHMRFNGAWHLYREGEPWRRSSAHLRVAIAVPGWVAVCFGAPVVETAREFDRYRHPSFGRLGPDLCCASPDADESVRRVLDYEADAAVADVLLDQHVACGIGNVMRSEVLWDRAVHPLAAVGDLSEGECSELIDAAVRLLRANVVADLPSAHRELAVYGRNGQPCARCGDTIEVRRMHDHERLVYWCGGCQTVGLQTPVAPPADDPVMDPHPAATKFLADLPWRRDELAG